MGNTSPVVAMALALTLTSSVGAQPTSRTLFDQLPAVGVHVVGINPAIDSAGIDSLSVRLAVESRLQKEGLATPGRGQLTVRQDTPRLIARLAGFSVDALFFYTVTLELVEPVRLERSGLKVFGYGWSRQVVGVADRGEVRSAVEGAIDQLAGMFLENRRRALSIAGR